MSKIADHLQGLSDELAHELAAAFPRTCGDEPALVADVIFCDLAEGRTETAARCVALARAGHRRNGDAEGLRRVERIARDLEPWLDVEAIA